MAIFIPPSPTFRHYRPGGCGL